MMKLTRCYEVQAAHQLSAGVPEGHPCRRLHGHRYLVGIDLKQTPGAPMVDGMLMEYAEIDRRVWEVLGIVDHHFLNTVDERAKVAMEQARAIAKNSTVENFAVWVLKALQHTFPSECFVSAVRIEEDSDSVAEATRD